jgi:hypothetical protein
MPFKPYDIMQVFPARNKTGRKVFIACHMIPEPRFFAKTGLDKLGNCLNTIPRNPPYTQSMRYPLRGSYLDRVRPLFSLGEGRAGIMGHPPPSAVFTPLIFTRSAPGFQRPHDGDRPPPPTCGHGWVPPPPQIEVPLRTPPGGPECRHPHPPMRAQEGVPPPSVR